MLTDAHTHRAGLAVAVAALLIATPGSGRASCTGDCNGDGMVTITEVITMVNVALGSAAVTSCPAGDADNDGAITVDEILVAVRALLDGCPEQTPTQAATPSPTGTNSPSPTLTGTATPTTTSTPVPGSIVTGQLVGGTGPYPGGIGGVHFRSGTQSGFTDDTGTFTYVVGEPVTFSVADVDFRSVVGAPLLSPWQLAATGECTQGSELSRLLVLLYSLDVDNDQTNGTAVPNVPPGSTPRSFAALTDADIAALVDLLIPGRALVDSDTAEDLFITQMDGEAWQQIGIDEFPGTIGAVRSQGLTTDGSSWYFSWTLGLEKTDLNYTTEVSKVTAIPPELSRLGDRHIGDIDYWGGTLYAPLEDTGPYVQPHIALYDPATLVAGQTYALPNTLLTDGVPWVAVDGPRGNIYVAVWDPTLAIFVFDLATVTYSRSIPLRPPLARIQGAKVFEGSLYLSTDDAAKDIFKVNLDTGTVIPLFALNQDFEEEGLAFLARPDGSLMHTLNVFSKGLGTELRHHQRTRLPLRHAVCS